MVSVNDIFSSLKWMVLILALVSSVFGAIYSTPESQAAAMNRIGLKVGTPEIDTPAILEFLWILWIIFIMSQTSWKMLKVASDRVMMDGLNKTESCIASDLHAKGDLGFLRVGGAKLIPDIEGTSVWINPLTHIHKIGNTIVMEAHAAPDTGLADVPPELKDDIYQRRGVLFGLNMCSVGYLSAKEMQEHTEFNGNDYNGADQADKKQWTTATFITEIMTKNKAVSVLFDYFGDDVTPIEKKLASIKRIGAAANRSEKKGILDYIMINE